MAWKIIVIVLLVGLLSFGAYNLVRENNKLEARVMDLTKTLKKVEDENGSLEEKINYFNKKENLVKELKSQFNYRKEGEELLIVIPKE